MARVYRPVLRGRGKAAILRSYSRNAIPVWNGFVFPQVKAGPSVEIYLMF